MNICRIKPKLMKTKQLVICLGIIAGLLGCNSGSQKSTSNPPKATDTTKISPSNRPIAKADTLPTEPVEKKDSIATINFLLPSPDEILSEIIPGKVEFNPQLVNPKTNVSNYLDTKYQALNLGVYLTDFAYLNLNDKKNEALAYFKVIRNLAQKVNIYGLFNQSVYDRIQNNLANKDSLSSISKELYYNMLDILESAKRNNIYALAASGALIEALYISTMVVKNYTEYQTVAQKIFEQKYVVSNFYEFASQFEGDKDVKSILIQINNLKQALESSPVKTTEKKVKMDKKDHFIIGGGEEIIINEVTFKHFKENVIKTRNSFIKVLQK
jgi:hypothetical protein